MAIPGARTAQIDIRAKVRVGERREGSKFPSSLDYFVSDDPEFGKLHAEPKPNDLRIVFVHEEPGDVFRTGLEWWKGKVLACYSDEGGASPTAFRVSGIEVKENGTTKTLNWLDPDDEVRGAPVGRGRTPIACQFRNCRHFGKHAANKECRVKGRLTFLLEGGRADQALQFETKGWKTIEGLEATLAACRRTGPLNAPGRVFVLHVETNVEGDKRHPVVSITEENVEVTTETIDLADKLVTLRKYVETEADEVTTKLAIADVLDETNAGWRENPEFIVAMQARVAEIGVLGAAKGLLARFEA